MYNNQWLVLRYPAGAGGKFIAALLFLFDKVEHWYGIQDPQSQLQFYRSTISQDMPWLDKELNQDWGLDFFGRSYERNNDLTTEQFNQLVDQSASNHFKSSWTDKKIIVDHWHKPWLPEFWQNEQNITIVPDDFDLLHTLIKKKLFKINTKTKLVTSVMDAPMHGSSTNRTHAKKYQNVYEFGYENLDQDLVKYLMAKPWYGPWTQQQPQGTWTLMLSDLLSTERVLKFMQPFEELYQQKLDADLVAQFHQCWKEYSFDK